jgi:pectate lyase
MSRIIPALILCLVTLSASAFPPELLDKPDAWYNSEEGRTATSCVLSWQSEQGIWPKNKNTALKPNPGSRAKVAGTFDNKATTDELRYLARAYRATSDAACKSAFLLGLDCILKAQYTNGGWPQSFPLGKKVYPHHITFNDGAMIRVMQFLQEVATNDVYAFVAAERRTDARQAVVRGIECIVRCQVIVAGQPTVWCAQHDAVTLAPTLARAYELPSLSGSESAGILRFLMALEKPTPAVIAAVKAGTAWFESAKIKGIRIVSVNGDRQVIADAAALPMWARFYDLETGRPFFCDRDGVKKSELAEISKERRNGYSWYGGWGDAVAKAYAKWPHH